MSEKATLQIDRVQLEREGWEIKWIPDSEADPYDWDGEGRLGEEAYGCTVKAPYSTEHEHEVSLWGIWDPDDAYRKQVEEELLSEALAEAVKCPACGTWKPKPMPPSKDEIVAEQKVERWKTRYREAAQGFHFVEEGVLEVDDNAEVSMDDPRKGAYVQAWIWVGREDL